ncbi:MAG: glycosyltransferase family 61 protein [Elusimicrobiota bacterium]|jgi:hypothetical protein|nr:glycosyltransferase family 61 protein [Elusimicrobiota bacterium]
MIKNENIKRLYMDDKTKEDFEKVWYKNHWRKEEREVVFVKNAVITPAFTTTNRTIHEAAVLDENKKYVEGSGTAGYDVKDFIPPLPADDDIDIVDKDVIWGGRIICHYGHFLIQSTLRLYYYIKNKDKYPNIAFIINKDDKLPEYIIDFFDLLEIPRDNIIYIKSWTKFRTVICPPIASEQYDDYTDDFILPFNKAAQNIEPGKYKKIFFSRKFWTDSESLGEETLEKVFNKNGFVSVYLERLSLRQQISIIKGAEIVAGINGTAFHNALFASPNLKLIMLNRNEEFDFQYVINEAAKTDWYVIRAYANPFPVMHARGPFIVGFTEFLKDFFKDHNLNSFNASFKVEKYIKDFVYQYCKIYGDNRFGGGLTFTNKDSINAFNAIKAIEISSYSIIDRIIYYILYHITLGNLKRKFKRRHRAIKSFLQNKNKIKWNF